MSHKEWRSFGFSGPGFVTGPSSSFVFYNSLAASDTLLRVIVSCMICVPIIEDGINPTQAPPIMCQVDNFGGAEGTPPPDVNSNPHPLARFMPTLYPGPAVGVGDVLLPVITRLWVGGTGSHPISVQGQRDADGTVGGRHMAFTSQPAYAFSGVPFFPGAAEYTIDWMASMLVLRTP